MKSNLCSTLNVSLCLIIRSPLLTVLILPSSSQDSLPVQIFQGAGLKHGELFGRLFRWAAADDTIVWSALLSKDHPAGSCCREDQQAGQETGNRKKKKAGHPDHQGVKHDITKASLFNEEYLIRGQIFCRCALKSPPLKYISIYVLSLCVSVAVFLRICLLSLPFQPSH